MKRLFSVIPIHVFTKVFSGWILDSRFRGNDLVQILVFYFTRGFLKRIRYVIPAILLITCYASSLSGNSCLAPVSDTITLEKAIRSFLEQDGYQVKFLYPKSREESLRQMDEAQDMIAGERDKGIFLPEDSSSIDVVSHELLCNLFEFGSGGIIAAKTIKVTDTEFAFEITAWDFGPGMDDIAGIARKSIQQAPFNGFGFYYFSRTTHLACIESRGVRWEKNLWGDFIRKGKSSVKSGTYYRFVIFNMNLCNSEMHHRPMIAAFSRTAVSPPDPADEPLTLLHQKVSQLFELRQAA